MPIRDGWVGDEFFEEIGQGVVRFCDPSVAYRWSVRIQKLSGTAPSDLTPEQRKVMEENEQGDGDHFQFVSFSFDG